MIKVFLSQRMKGKTDAQIKAVRNVAIAKCKATFGEDVEILDSYRPDLFQETKDEKNRRVRFLSFSILMLADADVVIGVGSDCLSGDGTYLEYVTANRYGIPYAVWNDEMLGLSKEDDKNNGGERYGIF